MYYGQPFLEISVPKEGKVVKGDPRYLKHGDAGSQAAFGLNATFTVAELAAQWRDDLRRVRQPAARSRTRCSPKSPGWDARLSGPRVTIAAAGLATRWAASSGSATRAWA